MKTRSIHYSFPIPCGPDFNVWGEYTHLNALDEDRTRLGQGVQWPRSWSLSGPRGKPTELTDEQLLPILKCIFINVASSEVPTNFPP